MGYILSKKLKCIDKILARDRGDAYGIDNTLNLKHKNIKHISTFETIDINYLNSISSEKWKNKNYLYIENS